MYPGPRPGVEEVNVEAGREVAVGQWPLALRLNPDEGVTQVTARVEMMGPDVGWALSPVGIVFSLQTRGSETDPVGLEATVNYEEMVGAYGGGFASRLALFEVSGCEWRSQVVEGEEESYFACRTWRQLPGEHDYAGRRLTVRLGERMNAPGYLPPEGERIFLPWMAAAASGPDERLYVLATTSGGEEGDYSAEPLALVKDYQVGLVSGTAQTSYSFPVPPPPAGPVPEPRLQYDSGGIDGMSQAKNNQPGSVGLGWSLDMGSVQRVFRKCNSSQAPGDLCLNNSVYYLNLNGVRSLLVSDSGVWKLQSDPRWKIERLRHSNNNHPDSNNHFYWVVTTPDGTKYTFGAEFDVETGADLNSAWYVPTYSTQWCTNDPYRVCNKVWKWNLDRIEDPNGNVATISYEQELNYYLLRSAGLFAAQICARGASAYHRIWQTQRTNRAAGGAGAFQ
ncbi:MAG: hypothetical protein GXP42_09585 [Chloroflexi bacterium]|nr:hypothetical protein [Chloroflexota bacterium]